MAFKVVGQVEQLVGAMPADRRLYLAPDERTVLEEGDPRAAFLLCAPGHLIPAADAARFGLTLEDGRIVLPGTVTKMAPVPENKMQEPEANKARKRKG